MHPSPALLPTEDAANFPSGDAHHNLTRLLAEMTDDGRDTVRHYAELYLANKNRRGAEPVRWARGAAHGYLYAQVLWSDAAVMASYRAAEDASYDTGRDAMADLAAAILAVLDAPVTALTEAAQTHGNPLDLAVAHVVAGVALLSADHPAFPIPDPDFFGAAIDAPDGIVLALPAGRTQEETDMTARHLLGQVLDTPLSSPPGCGFTTL